MFNSQEILNKVIDFGQEVAGLNGRSFKISWTEFLGFYVEDDFAAAVYDTTEGLVWAWVAFDGDLVVEDTDSLPNPEFTIPLAYR